MMFAFIDVPGMSVVVLPLAFVCYIVPVWLLWVAFKKAGLPGSLGLIALVPLGFIIALAVLAFSRWPNEMQPE